MRLALAQINTTVGDFEGNSQKILDGITAALKANCQIVAFPELALTGYPPQDLLSKKFFLEEQTAHLMELARACQNITAIVGQAEVNSLGHGKPLFNSAALLRDGKIIDRHHKMLIPTYDVFDEARYFEPAKDLKAFELNGERFGITICEDIWNVEGFPEAQLYAQRPLELAKQNGARWILNISASPFHLGKNATRQKLLQDIAKRYQLPVAYVNLVGANDGLIFDGNSLVVDAAGKICAEGKSFAEDFIVVDIKDGKITAGDLHSQIKDEVGEAREALVLGLRDYAQKCGFKEVVIGISGGIDSALVAALAVEALGKERIWGVAMPSRFSSKESFDDAQALAKNLGIRFDLLSIEAPHAAFLNVLAPIFKNSPPGTAEENLQARLRGTLLMALSNKFGHLLLSTGNKSEMAVGYTTLYGDMNGGLAVIGDVPKTLVYRIAETFNKEREIIPKNIFKKAPTAELRPNQKDQDTLPPYDVLDRILSAYVHDDKSIQEIAKQENVAVELVTNIVGMTDRAEYKRRQAPPTLRITSKAFGSGRRLPIAQRYQQSARGKSK